MTYREKLVAELLSAQVRRDGLMYGQDISALVKRVIQIADITIKELEGGSRT